MSEKSTIRPIPEPWLDLLAAVADDPEVERLGLAERKASLANAPDDWSVADDHGLLRRRMPGNDAGAPIVNYCDGDGWLEYALPGQRMEPFAFCQDSEEARGIFSFAQLCYLAGRDAASQEFPWEGMGPTPEEAGGSYLLARAPDLGGPLLCVGWRPDLKAWADQDGGKLGADWSPVSWRRMPALDPSRCPAPQAPGLDLDA